MEQSIKRPRSKGAREKIAGSILTLLADGSRVNEHSRKVENLLLETHEARACTTDKEGRARLTLSTLLSINLF